MTSEGIKKAIEASEKLEKELLSLNKKDQWTLTKPTIQNFKITALDDLLTQGITVEPGLIFGSQEWLSPDVYLNHLKKCVKVFKLLDSKFETELSEANLMLFSRIEKEILHLERYGKSVEEFEKENLESDTRLQRFDLMDQLLLDLKEKHPSMTSGEIWYELGRELDRKKRRYDKNYILSKYRPDQDNPKKTIIWIDSSNSEKETPMTIRTLCNRLTPIKKFIKNKIH